MRVVWVLLLLGLANSGYALGWRELWLTKDQQAQLLMQQKQFDKAETLFQQQNWRAAAAYRAGHYEQAAKNYQLLQDAQSYYNQGNALAHLGRYESAIKAYDKALALKPDNQDAIYNRKLLEELLKKERQQQNKDKQERNQQAKDQQSKDQQGENQQDKDQQSKDQQGKDQQGKAQPNQDQQSKSQQGQNQKNEIEQKEKKTDKAAAIQTAIEGEKQQAKEQWLRLIPDDPGGLLREKFLRDHLRRQKGWYQ